MTPSPPLWPHQKEAVDAAAAALAGGGRATVVMACGTGKTRVAAEACARLAPTGRRLVVVPTLELLYQSVHAYRDHLGAALGRVSAACSLPGPAMDATTASADEIEELEDEGVLVTTDPAVLHADLAPQGTATLFATFASLPAVAALHADHGLGPWDLVVVDEAHRSVGSTDGVWARVHENTAIPAARRLYMTATPRLYQGEDLDVLSMDDEEVFGPQVYRLPFATAIETGLLADYRLVVSVVTDTEVAALAMGEDVLSLDGNAVPARMAAAQIALLRAIDEYGLRRVITYHNTVAAAHRFAGTLVNAAPLVERAGPARPVAAYPVDGSMGLEERRAVLRHLRAPGERTVVVSNCRVLSEGVDVPELDGVAFVDPRGSGVDVVQAVGRALRKGSGTTGTATILVPLTITEGETAEAALEGSAFDGVWRIVRALRAHDERVADHLDRNRARHLNLGGNSGSADGPTWFVTSGRVGEDFARAIALRMVETSTSRWWEGYGVAEQWYAEHGHLRVPEGAAPLPGRAHSGQGRQSLLGWLTLQRQEYRRGILSRERRELLEAIGIVWDPREEAWEANYALAAEHSREHGGVLDPHREDALARWVYQQRQLHRKGALDAGRIARLDRIGMVWDPREEQRRRRYRELARFRAEHGHLRPPHDHPVAQVLMYERREYRLGKTSAEHARALEALGVVWDPKGAAWWDQLDQLRRHHAAHGVPAEIKDYGPELSKWLVHQRGRWAKGQLPLDRAKALAAEGITPSRPHKRRTVEEIVAAARRYWEHKGTLVGVPTAYTDPVSGLNLGRALVSLRARHKNGTLPDRAAAALEEMGMRWSRSAPDPAPQR